MNAASRKMWRDLWQERSRGVLVVLAIALGIAGFTTVLASYAILLRELNEGYLATAPASATLLTDKVDDELLAAIEAPGKVARAEARRRLSGRIRSGPGRWRNLQLFVVKDYGQIELSRIEKQEGAWPPAAGEILIERDAFQVFKGKIGDQVRVKTSTGNELELRVAGSVKDVGQAQARMENIVYGYITLDTLKLLGEEPILDRILLQVAEKANDEKHVRAVAAEVEQFLESRGHKVRRVEVPKPGQHPHADLMGMLLLAKAGFGIFILALSSILVINLLSALMAAQIRQVAVMKTIGGSRRQIAAIYFGQVLLLSLAALALGLPLGLWGSRLLCRYQAKFLNFDLHSFALPLWVYALVALVGLFIPLLAAAWPVFKGTGVPVLEALADHGVAATRFGGSGFDRLLAGFSGPARPILLAVRNGFRRRTRLVLTLLALVVAGLFFLSALNVRASLINTLDQLFAGKKYDLSVTLAGLAERAEIEAALRKVPGITGAECWIASEGSFPAAATAESPEHATDGKHPGGRHGGGAGSDRFAVFALPAGSDYLAFQLEAGRVLSDDDDAAIVINRALADKKGLEVGDTFAFQLGPAQTSWQVVGIAREAFSPAVAYLPLRYYENHHPGKTNSLRLRLASRDENAIEAIKADLDQRLEAAGQRALAMTTKEDSRFGFDQHMVMIYIFLLIVSAILGSVGGLGLATTMSSSVLERKREIGILRAIGASPAAIRWIFVAEGAAIGLLSWILAALLAFPFGRLVGDWLARRMFRGGLDFTFEPIGLVLWLAIVLLLGALASFLPAFRASRGSLREALAYE